MRSIIIFILLVVIISANGQIKSIFKNYNLDNNYTLLSLSPDIKGKLLYPDYCFYCQRCLRTAESKVNLDLKKEG